MSNLTFSVDSIIAAFRKLKRLVYYDKTNLILRRRLSKFENSKNFKTNIYSLVEVLNDSDPSNKLYYQRWIDEISYFTINKKLENVENVRTDDATFITNLSTASKYNVEKVNYFFDGPIELQIIAVLWLMNEGHYLDKTLGSECYGARLENTVGTPNDESADLYCRYHELYKKWRDQGIKKAKEMLTDDKKSVCILGLDIKEYYYHASLDYNEIVIAIHNKRNSNQQQTTTILNFKDYKLLFLLEQISKKFKEKISDSLLITHPHIPQHIVGIPIGLVSSPLLADWYLRDFDRKINEDVRPAYYGRYVDDIFIVVTAPEKLSPIAPVDSFVENLLVKTGVIQDVGHGDYQITSRPSLVLQKSKCILQHFDVEHSIAGLEKFQKKLESNASDFLLMPVDEDESSLEEVAYEILYDGSVNKFRSVKGIAENKFELAKHLSRQTMLHLLTDDLPDNISSKALISFFKGKNAIEFHDIWEKVFTFFHISGDHQNFLKFKKALLVEISRISHSNNIVAQQVRDFFERHLDLSMDMALSLGPMSAGTIGSRSFRKSNLLRHHFVRVPLTNYTNYDGSLTSENIKNVISLTQKKLLHSPRFVNFDECVLFLNHGKTSQDYRNSSACIKFKEAKKIFQKINRGLFKGAEWVMKENQDLNKND